MFLSIQENLVTLWKGASKSNPSFLKSVPYNNKLCFSVCLNGGTCLPLLNDLICLCPDSHRGKYCEYNKNVGAASKDNDVFETSKEDDDVSITLIHFT